MIIAYPASRTSQLHIKILGFVQENKKKPNNWSGKRYKGRQPLFKQNSHRKFAGLKTSETVNTPSLRGIYFKIRCSNGLLLNVKNASKRSKPD